VVSSPFPPVLARVMCCHFALSPLCCCYSPESLNMLQEEKKQLHLYLKSYEKEFTKANGRPVIKHEDILPVSVQYQRYKELKTLLKDA
jgi:hypothetical protein